MKGKLRTYPCQSTQMSNWRTIVCQNSIQGTDQTRRNDHLTILHLYEYQFLTEVSTNTNTFEDQRECNKRLGISICDCNFCKFSEVKLASSSWIGSSSILLCTFSCSFLDLYTKVVSESLPCCFLHVCSWDIRSRGFWLLPQYWHALRMVPEGWL